MQSILCFTANNQRASMCVLYLVSCAYFSNVLVCLVSRVLFRHILLIILVKSKEISHPFQCTFGLTAAATVLRGPLFETNQITSDVLLSGLVWCGAGWVASFNYWVRSGTGSPGTRSPSLRLILRYRHKFYSHWQNWHYPENQIFQFINTDRDWHHWQVTSHGPWNWENLTVFTIMIVIHTEFLVTGTVVRCAGIMIMPRNITTSSFWTLTSF